ENKEEVKKMKETVAHTEKETKRLGEIMKRLEAGSFQMKIGRYPLAITHYDEILELDPENSGALLNKAYCLKRCTPANLRESLSLVEKALASNQYSERARYNRACY